MVSSARMQKLLEVISDSGQNSQKRPHAEDPAASPSDAHLLDAYSRAVIQVTRSMTPAVVSGIIRDLRLMNRVVIPAEAQTVN